MVGVVSIQGNFAQHMQALRECSAKCKEVRVPEDLEGVERLIIPGGESSTVGLLMQRFGLGAVIQERVEAGMPIWGTCMGMILLAHEVEDKEQYRLNLLDITVRRNAFGRQVHSFEQSIAMAGVGAEFPAVFIRAPAVTRIGPGVTALAEIDGVVVAVRQGRRLGTSFHPELTADRSCHEFFLGL